MASSYIRLDDRVCEFLDQSVRDTDLKRRLREETALLPGGRMQISPLQGQFMEVLIRAIGAKRTIEIGVFTGYSALCTAIALPEDGKIVACDVSHEWTSVGRRYWAEAGIGKKIDLRLGPAVATLDSLIEAGEAGQFDFVFIDADKPNYPAYYDRAVRLVRPGGLIAIDNTLWGGKAADPLITDEDTLAIREINRIVHEDQRVTMCHIPVGDGLILAVRAV